MDCILKGYVKKETEQTVNYISDKVNSESYECSIDNIIQKTGKEIEMRIKKYLVKVRKQSYNSQQKREMNKGK